MKAGVIREFTVDSAALGLARCEIADVRGGDRLENARILLAILGGSERGPKRDTVLLNSAAGFVIAGLADDLAAGIAHAREQIASGRALAKLTALRRFVVSPA